MLRRFISPMVLILALAAASDPATVLACGDSLYRVGKGVAYRVYTAPLPGNVLIYSQQPGAKELAEALSRSGHQVSLATNELEFGLEMQSGQVDVVIAPYSEHRTVETGTEAVPGTTYLPVARNDVEEDAAREAYKTVMLAERDELKQYLKAIHKALKRKA